MKTSTSVTALIKTPFLSCTLVASAVMMLGSLTACDSSSQTEVETVDEARVVEEAPTVVVDSFPGDALPAGSASAVAKKIDMARLEQVLSEQSDETKARYQYRNPKETIAFFGIQPGSTVVEVLPGGGWYSSILVPYVGSAGRVIGLDYPSTIWTAMGRDEDYINKRMKMNQEWIDKYGQLEGGASVSFYPFDQAPADLNGQVDTILFIRALHNMARLEEDGKFLSDSLHTARMMLKPGGTVGVVQHAVAEDGLGEIGGGSKGYLKASTIKNAMTEAGFNLVAESDINLNPADQPSAEDSVWRLLPSLATSKDDPEKAEKMRAIGESNRVTMLFQKPLS